MRKAQAAPPPAIRATSFVTTEEETYLPYGRQCIEDDDIEAVASALRGEYLTTGPFVGRFEQRLASFTGAREATACSNGTSALYIAVRALGLGPGDRVIVPAITFLATASAPHLAGAEIEFSDVDPESGLMRACDLETALDRAPDARAVFPVHYAGQCCDMEAIAAVARSRGMRIVEDAAHALGTAWVSPDGALLPVGANAHCDLTTFSFHPVKTVAMGEGGAVTANDPTLIAKLRQARNHGITREANGFQRTDAACDESGATNPWYYELESPGFNFRISDVNCALGLSQLAKLDRFVARRRTLAAIYDELLRPLSPLVKPLKREARSLTAWHLYAVRIAFEKLKISRATLMRALAAEGIGTQVHYIPVHRQPYYAARYGVQHLPGADAYYAATLSLPLFPGMKDTDVERVVGAVRKHLGL
jgi:UDP-4-amino-4,6-dideoxy-N-acetyl-beta-L-altrosamine transaminase